MYRRAYTLVELLVGLMLAVLIMSILMTVLTSTLTFTRRAEGSLSSANTARGVFQMIERDMMGAIGYQEPTVSKKMIAGPDAPTKGLIDPARPCFFGASAYPASGTETVRPEARWVTASANDGSSDCLRVAYRGMSPADELIADRHVLLREMHYWDEDGVLAARPDTIAKRVKSIRFEALPASGNPGWEERLTPNPVGGMRPANVPRRVRVTLEIYADIEASDSAPVDRYVRVFSIPAGQWE